MEHQLRRYIILIGDGMADLPVEELKGLTPLQAAHTPNMDRLASEGALGLARTVPAGMNPGSDTANLSIFGYDPKEYYTGRAPLEALNMGIELGPNDVAFRCNIVRTTDGLMDDFTADHIENEAGTLVMKEVAAAIDEDYLEFYPGVSYRNILIWRNFPFEDLPATIPPHDITGREYEPHLPKGDGSEVLRKITEISRRVIEESPAVKKILNKYRGTPESLWLWGAGTRPAVKTLRERFGVTGRTISAVDLIHGIGRAAGLVPFEVPGATGYLDTDYEGKVAALFESLKDSSIVFLHVEAPDESGHEGNLSHKMQAIEDFDAKVVGPVLEGLANGPEYRLLVMPDHPTPLSVRSHTPDPVPFAVYDSSGRLPDEFSGHNGAAFSEKDAAATRLMVDPAHLLVQKLITL